MIKKLRKRVRKNYFLNSIYYILTYYKTNPKINFNKIDKVLFIAHPDDEIIFFSKELIYKSGWLVVCMTNGGNWVRQKEFISAMNTIGAQYKIFNYKDGFKVKWNEKNITYKIKSIIQCRDKWSMVATHNNLGEYGHFQHKELNRIVSKIYTDDGIYMPSLKEDSISDENRLPIEHYKIKEDIIVNIYKSQSIMKCFKRFIEHEGIEKKYN